MTVLPPLGQPRYALTQGKADVLKLSLVVDVLCQDALLGMTVVTSLQMLQVP